MARSVRWTEADVKCPFFRRMRWTSRAVVCESGEKRRGVAKRSFPTDGELEDYLTRHCCSLPGCESCPGYRAAWAKYE